MVTNDKSSEVRFRFETSMPQIQSRTPYSVKLVIENLTDEEIKVLSIEPTEFNRKKRDKRTGLVFCPTWNVTMSDYEEDKNNALCKIVSIRLYFNQINQSLVVTRVIKELLFIVNPLYYLIIMKESKELLDSLKNIGSRSTLEECVGKWEEEMNIKDISQNAKQQFSQSKQLLILALQGLEDISNNHNHTISIPSEETRSILVFKGQAPLFITRRKKSHVGVKIVYLSIQSGQKDSCSFLDHITFYPSNICLLLSVICGALAASVIIFSSLLINSNIVIENIEKEEYKLILRIAIATIVAIPILAIPKTITKILELPDKVPEYTVTHIIGKKLLNLIMKVNITDVTDGFLLGIILVFLTQFIPFNQLINGFL